jgi:predicted AlkP superfamily pyrophosphatase or phosphodiesterase
LSRKMLVLNVAALSPWEIGDDCPGLTTLAQSGSMRPLVAPEPALTCTSHATMLTGLDPCHHGIIGNGWYDRESGQVLNWGRSDNLVQGEKIWAAAKKRRPDFKAVNLFWRYCTLNVMSP